MPDAAGTALLELTGVTRSFGRVVVADNLSLRIGAGDIVGIVGPTGAGKTSLFSLIAGDLSPQAGTVALGGADVTRLDPARRCRRTSTPSGSRPRSRASSPSSPR